MAIKEISKQLGGVGFNIDDNPSLKLSQAWKISVDGKNLILKRYGSICDWNLLVLEKDEKEVYRIELKEDIRTEFFYGVFFRAYKGNQFSFIEYMALTGLIEKFPDKLELTSYLETINRKEKEIEIDRLKANLPVNNYRTKISLRSLEQNLVDEYRKKAEQILSA